MTSRPSRSPRRWSSGSESGALPVCLARCRGPVARTSAPSQPPLNGPLANHTAARSASRRPGSSPRPSIACETKLSAGARGADQYWDHPASDASRTATTWPAPTRAWAVTRRSRPRVHLASMALPISSPLPSSEACTTGTHGLRPDRQASTAILPTAPPPDQRQDTPRIQPASLPNPVKPAFQPVLAVQISLGPHRLMGDGPQHWPEGPVRGEGRRLQRGRVRS